MSEIIKEMDGIILETSKRVVTDDGVDQSAANDLKDLVDTRNKLIEGEVKLKDTEIKCAEAQAKPKKPWFDRSMRFLEIVGPSIVTIVITVCTTSLSMHGDVTPPMVKEAMKKCKFNK